MIQTDPLISTAALAGRLDDPSLAILDASWFLPGSGRDPAAEYALRHIPGAHFFDIDEISDHARDLPHMLSDPSEFAVAARRMGVDNASTVVVYDSAGLFSAPRVWWNFRVMGHAESFVLDGGLPRWMAEGRPVETGWRDAPHGDFKARPDARLLRGLDAVRRALQGGEEQIIDARAPDRFAGAAPEPRPGLRAGHMPGAINTPWSALVEGDALMAPDRLRAVFEAAGVDLERPIATTCGSGISAALLALALSRLGRFDVAVYDGSWAEWGGRSDTPVAQGR